MKNQKYNRIASIIVMLVLLVSGATVSAADATGTITRIYGSETTALDCKGFTEFYSGEFFAWFQMDTSIDSAAGMTAMLNQQVLGDSTLKDSANNKIKINGMTVKQINASAGNPYTAMVAFEPTGENKVRISVWLSWGATVVQDLFDKEQKSTVTLELLSGLKVPGNGYSVSNKVYGQIDPVKYSLDISELEYLDDPSHSGWTQDKSTWMKPMFENLEAQWVLVSDTPTSAPVSSYSSSTQSSALQSSAVSQASSQDVSDTSEPAISEDISDVSGSNVSASEHVSSEAVSASGSVSETDPESSGVASSDAQTEKPDSSVLPIIIGVLGVLILGGGIAYFILSGKKKGNS